MGFPATSPVTRLLAKVEFPKDGKDCWLFKGSLDKQGYGRIGVGRIPRLVHRVMAEHVYGPIPEGYEVDHICFVRNCVNPLHLEPVPTRINADRRVENHRFCRNGHEYTDENTRWVQTKWGMNRRCRLCDREASRRYASK